MKKLFEIPEIEVTYFSEDDIVATSGIVGTDMTVSEIENNKDNLAVMTIDVQNELGFTF